MDTTTYYRKPLQVEAVQVTEENILEVAKWCKGKVYEASNGKMTLEVKVLHPLHSNQTKAQEGDWVLKSSQGFKIYADSAFKKGFEKAESETDEPELTNMGELLREKLAEVTTIETETGRPVMAATDALSFQAPVS